MFFSAYNPQDPPELLFKRIADCQEVAIVAKVPYTTEQLLMNVVDLFTRAGIYARDMDDWERKPPAEQTYYNLRPFIQAAYQRRLASGLITATGSGYASNNRFAGFTADNEASEKLHDELLKNAEDVLQALGLAYRVVYVCTGDLGQGQVRKHDIETWMPSRKAYSETHSCSTFHDFQARRLQMRYRTKSGEVKTCYTLNNTAIATPRVLIPLLECYQQADGSVKIPDVLVPYMQGQKIIALQRG